MASTLSAFGIPTGPGEGRGGILQPKTKYKFRVLALNFGIPSSSIALTQQVMTCGRPNLKMAEQTLHSYNSVDYFAGKPEWESISMTVRDDVTNSVNRLVGAQIQKQTNFFQQTSPVAGSDYKFQLLLHTMDGSDDVVLEEWFLEGCFLSSVNYDSFDYSSSEALHIELNIRYSNATQSGDLMPMFPILTPGVGFVS